MNDPLAPLPEGYRRLAARARDVFEADPRVRAMWFGGSVARGEADSASDLDVLVAVSDEQIDGFAADRPRWLADIASTVIAEPLPFLPGSCFTVTSDFERFDVVVEPVGGLARTPFRDRLVVFDRDGLDDGWPLAREHLHHLSGLAYRLFVEANAPQPPSGVKQWSSKLTPAQRDALLALPTSAASVDELRRGHRAIGSLFVTNADALAARCGVEWPAALEDAARQHVAPLLGISDPFARDGPLVV